MLGILALLSLPGCSDVDCGIISRPTDRDWCFAEETVEYARDGRLSEAVLSMNRISDADVRATTVHRMIAARIPGMDRDAARRLCVGLPSPDSEKCLSDWDRPEAWGER